MLGNFKYHNPTKLYFGKDALENLRDELKNYGKNVLFVYGGGSIKRTGLFDKIMAILNEAGKNVSFDDGVMPNPTIEKLYEGIDRAKKAKADFILAVGGGSVIDYAKGLSVSINLKDEDPWQKYYINFEEAIDDIVPVGCVLTMAGTGSEMNGGSVISNHDVKIKNGKVFDERVFPKFAILNPELTYTVPRYQMVAGVFDIMSHIMEQYFSGDDDNTSDYIMEGLMRSLIHSSKIAVKNPTDYEARSNIMWTATWALNTLVAKGKSQDWEVHMIGQAIGAVTNATHGMTLSSVSIPYYKHIMPYGLLKFRRFAEVVWNVEPYRFNNDTRQIAEEGLRRMSDWMKEIGLVMNISELGVNESNIDDVIKATFLLDDGYKQLTEDELRAILVASM
ncbi:MAG: iron-containing alcohol dehydrogenase [Acholeplasmatales bacterium]|nr:iron-containing alcohol dehydrogenase [Acholeplasmatales bacterium]